MADPLSFIKYFAQSDLVNTLTVTGHPHHYAVGQGIVTSELMEFAAWKHIKLVNPIPTVDYLQLTGINI